MSGKKSEYVYDELISYLGSAFFQVPVIGFIENNCLIFDPSVEDADEYKKMHREYKKIVDALLDAFTKDSKLSHDEVIQALSDMNSKKDLREFFQGLFELVLAMDDFDIFVRLMTQKNIELQQQALMLIMKTQGSLPDSLTEGGSQPQPAQPVVESEDEILRKVMEISKREYENEQKRQKSLDKRDQKQMEKMMAISEQEVAVLEDKKVLEQQKMNVAMATMSIQDIPPIPQGKTMLTHDTPKGIPEASASSQEKLKAPVLQPQKPVPQPQPQKPVIAKAQVPVIKTPGDEDSVPEVSQTKLGPGLQPMSKMPPISGSQAAANWLQSAQAESNSPGSSSAVEKAAAAMAGMSADEIKKRQEYLRQQRDKLIAMKQKEREKQLLTAEQSNPGRPISAQAARKTLKGDNSEPKGKQLSDEEQKKIEMRRQIANKLKAELMGGN